MTNRTYIAYKKFLPQAPNTQVEDYSLVSGNSPKVNGKLRLRANSLTFGRDLLTDCKVDVHTQYPNFYYPLQNAGRTRVSRWPSYGARPVEPLLEVMRNVVLAKFNGKLHYGGASWGVTLASWHQSRDMIVKRMQSAQRALDRSYMHLTRDKRLLNSIRKERESLAGQVLETEFGWMPLVQDIKAALTTVCEHAIPDTWVTARHRLHYPKSPWFNQPGTPAQWWRWEGQGNCTLCAKVSVSNPNLWLANRMGLVNLPAIAWDLVPWSFVVNMFGNFNQLISSVTSEVGLSVSDRNYTENVVMMTSFEGIMTQAGQTMKTRQVFVNRQKSRGLSTMPAMTFQWKVPDLNWELALIASSLVVQRVQKLDRLIRSPIGH